MPQIPDEETVARVRQMEPGLELDAIVARIVFDWHYALVPVGAGTLQSPGRYVNMLVSPDYKGLRAESGGGSFPSRIPYHADRHWFLGREGSRWSTDDDDFLSIPERLYCQMELLYSADSVQRYTAGQQPQPYLEWRVSFRKPGALEVAPGADPPDSNQIAPVIITARGESIRHATCIAGIVAVKELGE